MVIINFTSTSKQALRNGFIKGIASPVMLFGNFDAPPIQKIRPIKMPTLNAVEALSQDWLSIGNDLNAIIKDR